LIALLIAAASIWLTGLTIRRYQTQLEEMAVTDKLTGLANRQAFAPLVDQVESDLKRNPAPLSVILADIDRFKLINDTCGHLVGDQVLTRTALALQRGLRESDLVFRWGGEEFMVLLRDCPKEDALRVAEKLRTEVDDARNPNPDAPAHVTLSLGVAERRPGESIEALIGRADNALYAAKSEGRNCVRSDD
jgi:diguanylate cyclase (GGDEF)-like protein